MYNYVLRFLMEINIKIHVEQLAPPRVHQQRSDEHGEQTDRQTKSATFLATPVTGEIRAAANFAW